MSLKDKLEIGLKPDAPYRKDNLPEFQQDEPACDVAATPGDSGPVRDARAECEEAPKRKDRPKKAEPADPRR
jgi:hypothetical protein